MEAPLPCYEDEEFDSGSFFIQSHSSDESFSDNSDNSSCDTFKVAWSAVEWSRIKPDVSNPNRLKRKIWSNVIANAIISQYALPCTFVFDHA